MTTSISSTLPNQTAQLDQSYDDFDIYENSKIIKITRQMLEKWQRVPIIARLALYSLAGCAIIALSVTSYNCSLNQFRFANCNTITSLFKIVFVPIYEEILYRGVLTQGIRYIQSLYNYILKRDNLTQREKASQEMFRVNVAAGIFGLQHQQYSLFGQFIIYWFLGRATGYLFEKTNLLTPIALHMFHNALAQLPAHVNGGLLGPLYAFIFLGLNKKIFPLPEKITPKFLSTQKMRQEFIENMKQKQK